MVRKILIYGDLDLNIIDGSSIWLVNLAKLLLEDKENYVDILLKKRIRSHILVGEIEKRYRVSDPVGEFFRSFRVGKNPASYTENHEADPEGEGSGQGSDQSHRSGEKRR